MTRSPGLFPNLRVSDPKSEIDWLVRVLGFETHYIADYDGQILHAELQMGDQLLFLQPDKWTTLTACTALNSSMARTSACASQSRMSRP